MTHSTSLQIIRDEHGNDVIKPLPKTFREEVALTTLAAVLTNNTVIDYEALVVSVVKMTDALIAELAKGAQK